MVNPRTFMDFAQGGESLGRVMFELHMDRVPKTAENFRALCTGSEGLSKRSGVPLHYKGALLHRVIDDFMIQGGDFTKRNGSGGESIWGLPFDDEDLSMPIEEPGLLVMANKGPNTNGSQFFITLAPTPHLNGKHVVFGRVVGPNSMNIIQQIAKTPVDAKDRPLTPVEIVHCGELELRKKAEAPPVSGESAARRRKRSASVSSAGSASPSEGSRAGSPDESRRRRKRRSSSTSSRSSASGSEDERERRKRKKAAKKERKEEKRRRKEEKRQRKKEGKKRSLSPESKAQQEEQEAEDARLEEAEKARLVQVEAERRELKMRELERLKREEEEYQRRKRRGGSSSEDTSADGGGAKGDQVVYKGRGAMRYRGSTGGMRSGAW